MILVILIAPQNKLTCITVYARRQDLQVALPCTRVSLGELVETIPQNTLDCARVTEATDVSESPNSGVEIYYSPTYTVMRFVD